MKIEVAKPREHFVLEQQIAQTSIYYTAPGKPYVQPSSNL